MTDAEYDYARGFAALVGGEGVADDLVRAAAGVAPETERDALFGPAEFPRDGWFHHSCADAR